MKCICCRSAVDEESACCQVCGFPLLGGNGSSMKSIAGEYRRNLLGSTVLSVEQYYYGYSDDGELQELESEYVQMANASELPQEGVLWFDTEFEPFALQRDIELHVLVQNGSCSNYSTLIVKNDKRIQCSKLGICSADGCRARFVVGNGTENRYSDEISLLIKQNH